MVSCRSLERSSEASFTLFRYLIAFAVTLINWVILASSPTTSMVDLGAEQRAGLTLHVERLRVVESGQMQDDVKPAADCRDLDFLYSFRELHFSRTYNKARVHSSSLSP